MTKQAFDEHYSAIFNPALELRAGLVTVRKLVANHKEALQKGTIVRKAQPDPLLSERIDNPLRSNTMQFLEMAYTIIKNLPTAMKFFKINIDYVADREQRFARGCERYETKHSALVAYLRKLRPFVLEVTEQFNKMRVEGWSLSNAKYAFSNGTVSFIEPLIGTEPVTNYIERIFNRLALMIEDLMMYGFQNAGGYYAIVEIPPEKRDPVNAQWFRRTLDGNEKIWQLT